MIIEQVKNDGRTKLRMTLEKLTNSFQKRNVAFVINAHSEFVGSITLIVTGKKGSAQKDIILVFNQKTEEWEGFSDGYCFKLLSISEISTVIKSKIQNLSTVLTKI